MIPSTTSRVLRKAADRVVHQFNRAMSTTPLTVGELLQQIEQTKVAEQGPTWTSSLSFASPESDFLAYGIDNATPMEWSKTMSFASPESDFVSYGVADAKPSEWSETLSFASPESDFAYREKQPELLLFSTASGSFIVKGN